jgi:glycosyltransferase involved in cell wall biosynthesis
MDKISAPTFQSPHSTPSETPDAHVPLTRNGGPTRSVPTISVVLNTRNEEQNIANAINSVRSWAHEIIVMDMESDDDTVQIAESLGAKVFTFPRVINFDAARVAAVKHATSDWILLLDADEVIPFELSRQLLHLAETGRADAYTVPRLNYFSGAPMHHAGWGPEEDRQLRFYRRGTVQLNDILHAHIAPLPDAQVVNLRYSPGICIVHFNYRDSNQFLAKLNQYTSLTAFQRKDSRRWRDRSLVLVPALEFLKRYLGKSGYLSGWRGFYYAFMMAAYRMTQAVKIREMQLRCNEENSAARYQEIAQEIVARYQSAQSASDPAAGESRGRPTER